MSTEPAPSHGEDGAGRNLRVLSVRALLVGWRGNVLSVVLQPFVLALGVSVAFLGLLESLGSYQGLIPTASQPLGGWLADHIGRKGITVIAGGLTALSLLLLAIAGCAGSPALLVPAILLLGLSYVGQPAADALVGESAAGTQVGFAYGQVTFAWALSGAIALVAGYLADRTGFPTVFAITAGLETLGALLVALRVRETLPQRRAPHLPPEEIRHLTRDLITPPHRLRVFYLAVVIDSFSYGLGSALLYGFLTERFGFTPLQFGIMTTVYSLSWAAAQLPAGRWTDRGHAKELLILAELLSVASIAVWLVGSSFAVFAASMIPLGVASALWLPALMAWVYHGVPDERRAEELGRINAVPGILAFPAPFIGGLLFERFGFALPIALNLAGALFAAAIIALGLRRPPRP